MIIDRINRIMIIDRIDWHLDLVSNDLDMDDRYEIAAAHIGYYIEWAYRNGFAPNAFKSDDIDELAQLVIESKLKSIVYVSDNCEGNFSSIMLNKEGLKFTTLIYNKYIENLENIYGNKPYVKKYNKEDLKKVFKYLDNLYGEYKKIVPKTIEELLIKMNEYNFNGSYYINNNKNIIWELEPRIKIEVILPDQKEDEAYIALPNGKHAHVMDDELFDYLAETNLDIRIKKIEKQYIRSVKYNKISNIFVMIFYIILLFGSWGAFFDSLSEEKTEIGVLVLALLFSFIGIAAIISAIYNKVKKTKTLSNKKSQNTKLKK